MQYILLPQRLEKAATVQSSSGMMSLLRHFWRGRCAGHWLPNIPILVLIWVASLTSVPPPNDQLDPRMEIHSTVGHQLENEQMTQFYPMGGEVSHCGYFWWN
jgi:hypothetical protein